MLATFSTPFPCSLKIHFKWLLPTGMVLTVAQTLLSALQTKEVRQLCSLFAHESQLADLERTVETINAVLLDSEPKHQELNSEGKDWIGKLKDAVYDADDLFDKFNTIAQKQKSVPGGKISKKVRRFFSGENQLLFAANTSRKIKKLRMKLDGIAEDRAKFGFSDVYIPVKRREETSSYVNEHSIIGRDADKKAILDLLFQDSDAAEDNVSFVSIVGIGGLGKTALAQFVFQDDMIKSSFELCFWVCVSEEFGLKEILSKMLGKSTELNLEGLQKEVRDKGARIALL
ncbi:disease resistance protein RGA2 [Spinacia oleracea]|uniref:Disease resistance protein RGA2 n=1 Tax=Spinacia oleracea TaxID=3562 RepID=A0ABM3RSM7_SPIOL|nr:disease resistance protein RGA2-like [Spinacia oleracea]